MGSHRYGHLGISEGPKCDGGQEKGKDMSRWESWGQTSTPERWKWLKELGFYPRRGPVRSSVEDLRVPQIGGGEEFLQGTEIEEGITGRSNELIDRTNEPKLTAAEWSRLKRSEWPCSKEEWRPMPNTRKWQALGNLGFSKQEKRMAVEAPSDAEATESDGQVRPAPQSAKPPPPAKPHSAYSNDKPRLGSISEAVEKGTIKGKARNKAQEKGSAI